MAVVGVPVPVRVTDWLAEAWFRWSSNSVREPLSWPKAVGEKATSKKVKTPAAREAGGSAKGMGKPLVGFTRYRAGWGLGLVSPWTVEAGKVRERLPLFRTYHGFVLVVPTGTLPKARVPDSASTR